MPTHDPNTTPSRKVVAATAGAGIGTVTANLVLWGLDTSVFHHGTPEPVAAFVVFAVPAVLAFLGGYFTRRSAAEVTAIAAGAPVPVAPAPAPVADAPNPPTVAELIDAHTAKPAKKVAAKKTAAKRPAKKAAPKPPTGLS